MTRHALLLIFLLVTLLGDTLAADDGGPAVWPNRPPRAELDGPVRLTFRGKVDGSDRIVIDQAGARWANVFWGIATSRMSLNGIPWQPGTTPYVPNSGATRFLAEAVDFSTARLESGCQGRDTVAVTPSKNAVTIRIADNPNGAGDYEFTVLFERASRSATLLIRARIEGSDDLIVTQAGAGWKQRHWGWPHGAVTLNTVSWHPRKDRLLANTGATQFLPHDVDFATARLVHVSGRDLASLETANDHLIVRFADTPPGPADYEVLIRFGSVD